MNSGQNSASAGQRAPAVLPPNFHIDPYDRRKTRWPRWVERLETAFAIYGVADNEMRRNLILHLMGSDAYEVLSDRLAPENPRTQTYSAIVATLQEYFSPEPSEISENFRFNSRHQGDKNAASPEETIDEFLVALRRIAVTCDFGGYLERALRNQLVFGVKRDDIRERLMERKRLTLQEARDIAVSMELSQKSGAVITGTVPKHDVHAFHNPTKKCNTGKSAGKLPKKKFCFRCGDENHLAKECKFHSAKCSFCGKKGHLVDVCMSKAAGKSPSAGKSGFKSGKVKANYIGERSHLEEKSDTQFVGEICSLNVCAGVTKMWLSLLVNDVCVRFEIDTGSPVSIINTKCYDNLFADVRLRRSRLSLVSYCDSDIHVRGVLDVEVQYMGVKSILPLYVVDSNKHPLLGREWLRVLAIDWNTMLRVPDTVKSVSVSDSASQLEQIFRKYATVFEDSIGKISSVQAKLHLQPNAHPVFLRARKIPFNMQKTVDAELNRLVAEGVLSKVEHSNWATPIVPVKKSENRVRVCGDYKQTVNPQLKVDQHPLPTIDELFASFAGGSKFSKIDLVQAYLQMEVAPEDREILTLNTHRGLYRPNRLMYGISSAPAIWQRQIETILQGIEGVSVFLDDIKVTGSTDAVHLSHLEEVLRRLAYHNIRVNRKKCEFFTDCIQYCGYLIDREGIHKISQKVEAIQNMPRPKNKDEVRSFVGLINYYGRFFENLSTVLYPLNNLLKKEVDFKWTKECEKSFRIVKERMQADNCLVHYSPDLPLLLATDASPYGVGAVLSHIYPDGSERPIQFASQTLNRTQQAYMQVDKEAYAIVFGVKKFFQYIYGRNFTLLTDNQAVSKIFNENKGLPVMSALRMQHYATFLQSFKYELRFRKSVDHANADALSRMPVKRSDPESDIEESDVVELNQIETLPLTTSELSQATADDKSVSTLIQGLKYGKIVDAKDRFGVDQTEFSLQKGCLLRGIRVYIPDVLRQRVLQELHSTHFGVTRTKSLARGYCWWSGMDRQIEELISNCAECQSVRPDSWKAKPHCWEPATEPFQRVHADFAGPFMDTYFFILVDSYTKWPEIKVCRSITAESTENMCREIFSTFGIPSVFVSDHGVQFTAESFQLFLKRNGIVHKMGAPYHPATNGQAERYVQTFKQKLKALKCPRSKINLELANILLTYRKMLHPSTGQSPSMMMFGRQIRSRLDLMLPKASEEDRPNLVVRQFADGDRVRVRDFLSNNKWQFGRVVSKLGKLRYTVRLDDGRIWERHVDHICGVGEHLPLNINQPGTSYQRALPNPVTTIPSNPALDVGTSVDNRPKIPDPTDIGSIPEPATEVVVDDTSKTCSPAGGTPVVRRESIPLRRSGRTIKPPQKLNL
ncbi:uncharacterized protein K02A2.6-like [Uranotaenia lowii]|uniref:uncharacterized protein K02A2.6-like n=1 Tax=Uranotaenia lowii TaxID=190385 RepID=UPI002478340C|nr:uncharacterized protein K02A2.6-like [Uranotaenia lowii]